MHSNLPLPPQSSIPSLPASSGNQHCYSLRKLPRGFHGNCSASSSYFPDLKGVGEKKKNLGRTRRLSDQSSDKEGHSNLWALSKITQWILELQKKRKKKADKLKGKYSGKTIMKLFVVVLSWSISNWQQSIPSRMLFYELFQFCSEPNKDNEFYGILNGKGVKQHQNGNLTSENHFLKLHSAWGTMQHSGVMSWERGVPRVKSATSELLSELFAKVGRETVSFQRKGWN